MSKEPRMVNCRNCNALMDKKAKICPSCGAKNKKPFYKRTWFIVLIILIVMGIAGSISGNVSERKDRKAKYRWPASELVSLLPEPESKYGKINSESEDYFSIEIYGVKSGQFEDYIEECKKNGFTEDYSRSDRYYDAENEDGFSLGLWYDEKTMSITLSAPIEEADEPQEEVLENQKAEDTEPVGGEDKNKETEHKEADQKEAEKNPVPENNLVNGMRPEFKEAMDSYEAFYDEYCDFMKKYEKNPTDMKLIAEYADMVEKLAEMDEKFAAWEDDDLNNDELKYYVEVNGRITQKLLEVSE